MTDMITVFVILAITIGLFVSDKLRLDLVAILSLLALLLTGIITTSEALAGFSNSLVMIIAALFVVGTALYHTGVAAAMGRWLARTAGTNEVRIIVLLMLLVAFLSAFMSSTGAVAVLLPVVVSLARDAKTSTTKLLIPLAYGSLVGGMLTLIGTPPNLFVAELLTEQGLESFGFFDFTPIGLAILVLSILYVVFIGRRLLPTRARVRDGDDSMSSSTSTTTMAELVEQFHLDDNRYRLRVRRSSPLVGRRLDDADLGEKYHVIVLERQPWPDEDKPPLASEPVDAETVIDVHDVLLTQGTADDIDLLCRELELGVRSREADDAVRSSGSEMGMAEVLIRRRSMMRGRTLKYLNFRNTYNVSVLGIMRRGEPITTDFRDIPLEFGDSLLVQGAWTDIQRLTQQSDVIVVDIPREMAEQGHTRGHAVTAIAIVTIMLVVMTLQLLPTVTTVLLAAVAMVLTGCLPIQNVYRSVNWESVVLIAAMLPMATALQKTGGVTFVADLLTNGLGDYGALAVMAGLFVITTVFSQFISNTATTVLIAPIALAASVTMGVSPYAYLMIVAIAASAAFATPIASPVNTLVLGPSGYRFSDFVRVGVPLQVLVLLLSLVMIPIFFPF